MEEELRKCPFCGGSAECFKDKMNEWSVICYDEYNDYDCCEVETSKYPTYKSAVDAWNTRITDPSEEEIAQILREEHREEIDGICIKVDALCHLPSYVLAKAIHKRIRGEHEQV